MALADFAATSQSEKMDEATLKNIVGQKITGSLGFMGGMLSKERLLAEQYYKGEPYGDEMVGRSQVVSHDVAEAIDSMLPALLKVFTSGDELVRFEPKTAQDEQMAKQQTEYVNHIWMVDNPGFTLLHDWFKDALWKKLGVIHIDWEEIEHVQERRYQGLSDPELSVLEDDEDTEITAKEQRQSLLGAPHITIDDDADVPKELQQTVHDVTARHTKTKGRVRIDSVAPEEFLIDHRAVTLGEAPFMCWRHKVTLTELKEAGYETDLVDTLGPDGAADFNMERIERFKDEDAYPYRDDNYADPSMREVWVNECYIKLDFNGDGYAELRKIVLAGESVYELLGNDEVDNHPFCTLTPIPMPHKVYGMSITDQTEDLQRIKTALTRGALDSIYFNIAPMMGIIDGQVNLDDALNRRPAGIIRMKRGDAILPIPSVPLVQDAWQMIDYIDSVREARTGVRKFNSTLDADQINPLGKTATAAQLADNAATDRLQLIARIFAETGIKAAAKRILELVCKHQEDPSDIRIRGQFCRFDPKQWHQEVDVAVQAGLGTGNKDQQLGHLMALAPLYQEIITFQGGITGPLVTGENLFNYFTKVIENSGLKSPEMYCTDPKNAPPQQPKPDPKMVEAQGKLAIQQQASQQKLEHDKLQAQAKMATDQAEAQADMQIAQMKAQLEAEIDKFKAQLQMQLEQTKAHHAMQLEQAKAHHETQINEHLAVAQADLIKRTDPNKGKSAD